MAEAPRAEGVPGASMNRIVPTQAPEEGPVTRPLERDHSTLFMERREPLGEVVDQMGNPQEIMAAYSTDSKDVEGSHVLSIVRDQHDNRAYGFFNPADGTVTPFDRHGNKRTDFEGPTFLLGGNYDPRRDQLTVSAFRTHGKNGRGLIETLAMPPAAK